MFPYQFVLLFNLTLTVFKMLLCIVPMLLGVAFYTLMERKVLSLMGSRMGPYKVSLIGVFQPFGDALKLMNKSMNSLMDYSIPVYFLSSSLAFMGSLFCWISIFSNPNCLSFKYFVLIVLTVLGLNSFLSMLMGWSTFTKYSMLGSMRSISQLISYEPVFYMALFFPIVVWSVFSSNFMMSWELNFLFLCPIIFYCWIPAILAELNRSPFDFSEGESELVSGFNTEFGSLAFTLIFLMEYAMMLFMALLTSLVMVKNLFLSFFITSIFIIWSRASLPRFRFDKLMSFSWKILIPMITSFFIMFLIWMV